MVKETNYVDPYNEKLAERREAQLFYEGGKVETSTPEEATDSKVVKETTKPKRSTKKKEVSKKED